MWIATKYGFYSVVDKGPEDYGFHIRARKEGDLRNLQGLVPGLAELERVELPQADYRWRICTKDGELIREVFQVLSTSVDYPNFKNEVARQPDQRDKLPVYSDIWGRLYGLQG